jgi:amanitin/phalloidin family toxin
MTLSRIKVLEYFAGNTLFPSQLQVYSKTFQNLQMSDINLNRLPFVVPDSWRPCVGDDTDHTLTRGGR